MNFDILRSRSVLAGLVLLLPGLGQTLEVEFYGGLAAGHAVQKQESADDTSDTSEKLYLGSRFLGPLGVEIAYHNLGKYNNAAEEITTASAVAVANLDIRGMTLFAKGGLFEWTETDLASGAEITGEDIIYGIGINLPVDKHVLFRTELEQFSKVGENDVSGTPGKDISMLSFGVNFKF